MGKFPDSIKRLIERFEHQSDQLRSPDYNETLIRIDFINPLMIELGWDIDNRQGFAEQYREVVHEERVRVAGQTKAPDYSFRVGGQRKFFLEAKKPAVDIRNNWEPAYQLRRYAWTAKLPVSLLTDFEELAIYDTRIQPKQLDKPSTARREFIKYTDYPERWDFLEGTFSKRAVYAGDFDRYCESKKGRGAQEFDDAFLEEIEEWRSDLASNLALRNDDLDAGGLNFAVQRIIDRIIFLRIAEDRGTEGVGQLQALLNGDHTYDRLQKLFHDADVRYNSGLFHFVREKDRDEPPDTLTPTLDVDDKTLKEIIQKLYYPQSPYEFTMVSADILGSIYERFLGKVITLTPGHRAKIEEKPEVRKAGGVYYTPTYIVDYIVRNTVGKLLGRMDEPAHLAPPLAAGSGAHRPAASGGAKYGHSNAALTPREASKINILDPACGSGSFLIGAYGFLLNWYLDQYRAADPAALATGKNPVLRPTVLGDWALTINARKRILLDHIHGVDIDPQAVEVTKLNLLLKCLEGETSQTLGFEQRLFRERALPDLGRNIQCGNSLIGTDIIGTDAWNAMTEAERRRINPFDYERAFPQVFKGRDNDRGFDAVIGNPPYVRQEVIVDAKHYLADHYKSFHGVADLYAYFIERGLKVMATGGHFGMIVSNKWLRSGYGEPLRRFLAESPRVRSIVDLAGLPVFPAATVRTVILIASKIPAADGISYFPPCSLDAFSTIRSAQDLERTIDGARRKIASSSLTHAPWSLSGEAVDTLLQRVQQHSERLADYLGRQPFFGVKTGLNEVFVVDEDTRQALIAKDSTSEEIIKPVVGGRDVQRYHVSWKGRYLILARRGIDIDQYPSVKAYLAKSREALTPKPDRSARVGRKPGAYRWYELQDAVDYWEAFEQPKIIFPDISITPRFTIDTDGLYGLNTTYIIPSTDRVLLAVLNSRAGYFIFKQLCAGLEGGGTTYLRFFGDYLADFPVPVSGNTAHLTSLVSTMLTLHQRLSAERNPRRREQIEREIAATDRRIDALVYQLYGLSEEEIKIVEAATGSPSNQATG